MAKPNCAAENAAHLAGRILVAWKLGPGPVLEDELDYASGAAVLDRRDTLEMEKMELLEGAAESLRNGRQGQVRAAVRILEHLAGAGASELSR
ncbi:MAG TPA: hypothetical protein VMH80_03015 [Bryobacteraceae bacterium]|nr:hypothetical protein [Bryobacteraceae bacterium]